MQADFELAPYQSIKSEQNGRMKIYEEVEIERPQKHFGFTKRQWLFLMTYGIYNVFRGVYILIGGPFYPPEAAKRNITNTMVGFVFGSYDFAAFLASIFYGKYLITYLGPHNVIILSTFNTSICAVLFGCLGYIESRTWFLTLSFILRIVGGAGDAGFYPSAFAIFQFEFPYLVSTTIGLFELYFGFGAIFGPIICGYLVDSIGFELTYISVGVCLLLSSVVILVLTPKPNTSSSSFDESGTSTTITSYPKEEYGVGELVKIPSIQYAIFNLFSTALTIGFVTGTLESHIEQFNLTSFEVGAVFSCSTAVYTVCCPLWGQLSDKLHWNKLAIMASGSVLIAVGFAIMGPLTFITSKSYVWTTILGLILEGIGTGSAIMLFFAFASEAAVAGRFSETTSTYGLVSSIFTLTFSLGNSFGPALSGALYDAIGFKDASLTVVGISLLVVIYAGVLAVILKKKKSNE